MQTLKNVLLESAAGEHWKKIGIRRRAGVLAPLFSLNTKNNMGIGEFPDLKLLVDWCIQTGNSIIQLLPMNDTGPSNSPYSAISAFALNPIFIAPFAMDGISKSMMDSNPIPEEKCKKRGKRFSYKEIFEKKQEIFELAFAEFERSASATLTNELDEYIEINSGWLKEYTLFISLKEMHGYKSWERWPAQYKNRKTSALLEFSSSRKNRLRFHSYLQWQAHKQFSSSHRHAQQHGVFIKGDIPFLVGRNSADVWSVREYFNMDISAGAPPDMFSTTGQKWGFPTFNWSSMASNDYSWYRSRLRQAEKYYDLYRIDHAIGLYRIYSINKKCPDGSIGKFDPEDESVWLEHGETIIKMMLKSSRMLPIAEDLGVVPECVRPSLRSLGIPRTIIDRWERDYEKTGDFVDLENVESIAMHSLSTHDTETLRQWLRNNPKEKADFFRILGEKSSSDGKLSENVHRKILQRTLSSSCIFSINSMQDLLSHGTFSSKPDMHRINIPSKILKKNWTYKLPVFLEDLIAAKNKGIAQDNNTIKELISQNGRC